MDAMNMMNMANMVNTINTINTVNAMNPVCRKENVFEGMHYRISVITEGLLRLEYSDDGTFEDRATQTVWNRKFPAAEFAAERGCKKLRITTRRLRLEYDEKRFSPEGLSITVTGDDRFPGREYDVWHFGEAAEDLGGTARTLDGADGRARWGMASFPGRGMRCLMTAILWQSQKMAGWNRAGRASVICISGDMGMITRDVCRISKICAGTRRCCQDLPWETGGADFMHTQKRAIGR